MAVDDFESYDLGDRPFPTPYVRSDTGSIDYPFEVSGALTAGQQLLNTVAPVSIAPHSGAKMLIPNEAGFLGGDPNAYVELRKAALAAANTVGLWIYAHEGSDTIVSNWSYAEFALQLLILPAPAPDFDSTQWSLAAGVQVDGLNVSLATTGLYTNWTGAFPAIRLPAPGWYQYELNVGLNPGDGSQVDAATFADWLDTDGPEYQVTVRDDHGTLFTSASYRTDPRVSSYLRGQSSYGPDMPSAFVLPNQCFAMLRMDEFSGPGVRAQTTAADDFSYAAGVPPLRLYPRHDKRLHPPTRSRGVRPTGYL